MEHKGDSYQTHLQNAHICVHSLALQISTALALIDNQESLSSNIETSASSTLCETITDDVLVEQMLMYQCWPQLQVTFIDVALKVGLDRKGQGLAKRKWKRR